MVPIGGSSSTSAPITRAGIDGNENNYREQSITAERCVGLKRPSSTGESRANRGAHLRGLTWIISRTAALLRDSDGNESDLSRLPLAVQYHLFSDSVLRGGTASNFPAACSATKLISPADL